jgi:hypothetical protein
MTAEAQALVELAERCEAATGADRGLDALIWWECGDGKRLCPEHSAAGRAVRAYYGADFDAHGNFRPETLATYGGERYTASLDAATTLVPEGWYWMAGNRDRVTPRAYVENGKPAFEGLSSRRNPGRHWCEVTAASPALALCAAALRARALSLIEATHGEGGTVRG